MIISALIDGRPYTFNTEDESQVIGEGGEAIVMKWIPPREFTAEHGNVDFLVKLFFKKTEEQIAADTIRQQKFLHFPRLPRNAISPVSLVRDARTNRIIGFVMPRVTNVVSLIELTDADYRRENGITLVRVLKIIKNLHMLIEGVHQAGVVIGDFNDKNVLVNLKTHEVFLIDVDSAQWGPWQSLVATAEFSDPTLLDEDQNLRPGARYSPASDWYSFTVMVYQLLTLTHPYRDGVHRPQQVKGKPIAHRLRFAQRIPTRVTVFDSTVHLDESDKDIIPPERLPEEFCQYMVQVFVKDRRDIPFPVVLLTTFRWMRCRNCGCEHGRYTCPAPNCGAPGFTPPRTAPTATPPPPVTPVGKPAPSRPAPTPPPAVAPSNTQYVATAIQGGKLRYVHYQDGAYRRENGALVWRRPLETGLSVLVAGDRTVFSSASSIAVINGSGSPVRLTTQYTLGKTTVAANSRYVYWVNESSLVRNDDKGGEVTIGPVLPNKTSVWVGERFGVAMLQAGALTSVKVFNATGTGFTGSYNLPIKVAARVIDATCVVNESHAWLVVTYKTPQGVESRTCYAFDASGRLLATVTGQSNVAWLGSVSSAALAVGNKLLVPVTGLGIARIGITGGILHQEGTYRGSAPLVPNATATVGLCLTPRGLVHIGRNRLTRVNS